MLVQRSWGDSTSPVDDRNHPKQQTVEVCDMRVITDLPKYLTVIAVVLNKLENILTKFCISSAVLTPSYIINTVSYVRNVVPASPTRQSLKPCFLGRNIPESPGDLARISHQPPVP